MFGTVLGKSRNNPYPQLFVYLRFKSTRINFRLKIYVVYLHIKEAIPFIQPSKLPSK